MKLQHIEASVVEVCVHLNFCTLRNGEFLNIFNRTLRSCLTLHQGERKLAYLVYIPVS